jgi:serine O-acetyltransferase
MKLFDDLRADALRYGETWARRAGFWVGATHRLGEWARSQPNPLLRLPVLVPWRAVTEGWRALLGVRFLDGADFGPGLYLPHPRGIVVGRVQAGPGCTIAEHVTIGTNANCNEFATLGANIELGPGARVLGPVRLGDGVRVGPNCVITSSIAAGARVQVAANQDPRTTESTGA